MEERKTTQIAATEVDINLLYGLYMLEPGMDQASQDEFYDFISTESIERELFLEKYCEYQYKEINEVVVVQFKVNQ